MDTALTSSPCLTAAVCQTTRNHGLIVDCSLTLAALAASSSLARRRVIVVACSYCLPAVTCNAITRMAMQNLAKLIAKSRIPISISISTKLKTCVVPIFLYGSEYWTVTKRDVIKIDALNQWCLRKLLGIK